MDEPVVNIKFVWFLKDPTAVVAETDNTQPG